MNESQRIYFFFEESANKLISFSLNPEHKYIFIYRRSKRSEYREKKTVRGGNKAGTLTRAMYEPHKGKVKKKKKEKTKREKKQSKVISLLSSMGVVDATPLAKVKCV